MTKTKRFFLGAASVGALSLTLLMPAHAQEAKWFDFCDANKDGIVSKQEMLHFVNTSWDKQHATMMKANPKLKPDLMGRAEFNKFHQYMMDPGKIGG